MLLRFVETFIIVYTLGAAAYSLFLYLSYSKDSEVLKFEVEGRTGILVLSVMVVGLLWPLRLVVPIFLRK